MLGLYVHIPFCRSICPYCDFHKIVASDSLKHQYVKSCLKEMELKNLGNYTFDTLYIGGGTPSCLSSINLSILLSGLSKHIDFSSLQEFTFECNPEDINSNLLALLKKYNVSRISLGVQSTLSDYALYLGRNQKGKNVNDINSLKQITKLLLDYGFNNYSFDLMYGYRSQTMDSLLLDIDNILSLNPKHISLYPLTVEPHTIFDYQTSKGKSFVLSDDTVSNMYSFINEYLSQKGYLRYEISNYALCGYESKHNLIYWNDEEYLSIGSGASEFINHSRRSMVSNISEYISKINKNQLPYKSEELLSLDEQMDEFVMMKLRLAIGLDLIEFKKHFDIDFFDKYPNALKLLKDEVLVKDNDRVYISSKYAFVSNHVIVEVLL